jgi:hypothetical protein
MKIKLTETFYQRNSYTRRYDELYNQVLDLDEDHYCPQANRVLELDDYELYKETRFKMG